MTTLEDLYYGNIIPYEHSFKRGREYSEALGYVVRNENDLRATFTKRQKEIFEKLKDCESVLHVVGKVPNVIAGWIIIYLNHDFYRSKQHFIFWGSIPNFV